MKFSSYIIATVFSLVTPSTQATSSSSSNFVINDECATAIRFNDDSLPFFDSKNALLASNNRRDPTASCLTGIFGDATSDGNTLWYRYDSNSDGVIIIDFSDYNTPELPIMSFYTGNCRNLSELICLPIETKLYYRVNRGQTYYIKLADYDIINYGTGIRNITVNKDRNYFYVIDANTNRPYSLLYDLYNGGDTEEPQNNIAYSTINTSSLSIGANFTSTTGTIRSVQFSLNGRPYCDNGAPYTLFGDVDDDIFGGTFTLGLKSISAEAYAAPNCAGRRILGSIQQEFIVSGCDFVYFSLYDAKLDKYLKTLSNGIDLSNPPCEMNIGLTFSCGFTPQKVEFVVRNASTNASVLSRNESKAPYFLFGDNGRGNVYPGSIPAGKYIISAVIDGITHAPVNFTVSGQCRARPIVDTTFDIDLRLDGSEGVFRTPFTYDEAKMFHPIVKRISSMIVGDKPNVVNTTGIRPSFFCGPLPPLIDDLHICAGQSEYSDDNDELLGFLFDSFVRESDGLPFSATILLDTTNFQRLKARGLAGNFILQQLIQTLGIGLLWSRKGLSNRFQPCSYNGTKAKAEFMALTGCTSDIPLEGNATTLFEDFGFFDCLFWDRNCLKNEVLTFSLGRKKVSRITLGSLEDLGYEVNYAAADPYGPNDIGVCAGCNNSRRVLADAAPIPTCHQGRVFEKAIKKGKEMLETMHEHHVTQFQSSSMPDGVVYMGNKHITVAYLHEDGMMCSVIVTSAGDIY